LRPRKRAPHRPPRAVVGAKTLAAAASPLPSSSPFAAVGAGRRAKPVVPPAAALPPPARSSRWRGARLDRRRCSQVLGVLMAAALCRAWLGWPGDEEATPWQWGGAVTRAASARPRSGPFGPHLGLGAPGLGVAVPPPAVGEVARARVAGQRRAYCSAATGASRAHGLGRARRA
jgi:hypothetical protein